MSRPPQVLLHPSTTPPSYIEQVARNFVVAVWEMLEAIVGISITECSWLKASLPSSCGGINLSSASLHTPAAYLASASCSQELVGKMLGRHSGCSPHIASEVAALSASASRPDWQALEDINVPLRQHSISLAVDETTYQRLLSSAPSTRAR